MSFFDNLFNIDSDNYYGVTGLSKELNSIYIYNNFIKANKSMLLVVSSLFEATNYYQSLLNYTNNVLLFPMDDFITSEALAISPELSLDRVNTLYI